MTQGAAGQGADGLLAAFAAGLPGDTRAPIGLAVSGGSDSLAMLYLAARLPDRRFFAVTVDHGLRADAADEARAVSRAAADVSLPHDVLRWQGWDGQGNLQDAARRARRKLMADWACGKGIGDVCLAHTRDDQAETVLMRLVRGAGVDGLSAMQPVTQADGVTWRRPLLGQTRADLRGFLDGLGVRWSDDPSNRDSRFERVRVRGVLAQLEALGVSAEGLAATAARLSEAREVLEADTVAFLRRAARQQDGDILIDAVAFAAAPREIRRRALNRTLGWIAPGGYPPRGSALDGLLSALKRGCGHTLHGVRALVTPGTFRFTREARAVENLTAEPGALWDGRWRLDGPNAEYAGTTIAMLGEAGLAACPDWRATGRPRASVLATPAVWQDDRLRAAPLAGWPNGWTAQLTAPPFV